MPAKAKRPAPRRSPRGATVERVYHADVDLRGEKATGEHPGRPGLMSRTRNGAPIAVGRVIA